ncbi:MAG: extracellular solute-binding protein [Actinomycetota bacterium]|nr:extracellular solute-binding protein [Actinomycetota bacterium]
MNKKLKLVDKLLIVFICLCVALTFSFVGCKKEIAKTEETTVETEEVSEEEETTTETEKGTEAETTIEESITYDNNVSVNNGEEITLDVWYSSSGWYEKWIEEYSKIHPNVKWNKVQTSGADLSKLFLALQSGENIDLYEPHNQFLAEIIPNTEPFPEDIFPLNLYRKEFMMIDENLIDGKMYFIPANVMTVGMVYNKKIWEDAGLTNDDITTTWEELVKLSKLLTVKDDKGKITVCGFCINTFTPYIWIAMQYHQGRFLFSKDGKTANINTPEGEKAAQYLFDLYYEHNVGDIGFPAAFETFGNQKTAISYAWGWMDGYLKYTFPDLEFGWFKIPTFDGNVPPAYDRSNVQLVGAVAAKTTAKEKAVAFDFLKYIAANDEAMIEFALYSGGAPTKYSIMKSPQIQENEAIKIQMEQVDKTIWPGAIPDIYMADLTKYLDEVLLIDKKPVSEVLKELQELVDTDLQDVEFDSFEGLYKYADELRY